MFDGAKIQQVTCVQDFCMVDTSGTTKRLHLNVRSRIMMSRSINFNFPTDKGAHSLCWLGRPVSLSIAVSRINHIWLLLIMSAKEPPCYLIVSRRGLMDHLTNRVYGSEPARCWALSIPLTPLHIDLVAFYVLFGKVMALLWLVAMSPNWINR